MMMPVEITDDNIYENIDLERIVNQVEQSVTRRLIKRMLSNICRCFFKLCGHVLIIVIAYLCIFVCTFSLDDPNRSKIVDFIYVVVVYIIFRISVLCCNKIDTLLTT